MEYDWRHKTVPVGIFKFFIEKWASTIPRPSGNVMNSYKPNNSLRYEFSLTGGEIDEKE